MRVFHEMFRCYLTVVYKELLLFFLSIRANLQTLHSHKNEISKPISLIRVNSKPHRTHNLVNYLVAYYNFYELPTKQEVKNIILKEIFTFIVVVASSNIWVDGRAIVTRLQGYTNKWQGSFIRFAAIEFSYEVFKNNVVKPNQRLKLSAGGTTRGESWQLISERDTILKHSFSIVSLLQV